MSSKWLFTILSFYFSQLLTYAQNFCLENTIHNGEGTHYILSSNDTGNCSFDHNNINPFYIGAINAIDYGSADLCGTCINITGPNGMVKVKIIDQCPECLEGDIDLSPEAFKKLAPLVIGRIPISWKIIPCEVIGNISLYYKNGSNPFWTAVQVRNHKNPIEKLAFWDNSSASYIDLPREKYNFFVKNNGMGVGPHQFRITDIYGDIKIVKNMNLLPNIEQESNVQFSDCQLTSLIKKVSTNHFNFFVMNNILNFNTMVKNYSIYNLTGKEIIHGNFTKKVNLNYLNKGVYIIKTQINEKWISHKFVL